MMNFPNYVTITARQTRSIDDDTGLPETRTVIIADKTPCAFSVLNAADRVQSWGEANESRVDTVTASLQIPVYGPELAAEVSNYRLEVLGYPGTWKIVTARPGREWTTYLVTQ